MGIFLAIGALISWTVGDFYIQRATKAVGDWKALFFIGFAALIVLTPFVYKDIPLVFANSEALLILLILSFITLISALFLFEGLKRGKISVIEPTFGLELPVTVILGALIWQEVLDPYIYFIILITFIGILLAVTKNGKRHKKFFLEPGVIFASIGAIGMGLINFLTGVGAQTISPLFTIWFMHSFLAISCFVYLLATGKAGELIQDVKNNPVTIGLQSFFDNAAWILYAFSMSLIPISIATAISESYIAFLVLLGIIVNKDRVQTHQYLGVTLAVLGVIILSALYG